jgi:hypothetical protein
MSDSTMLNELVERSPEADATALPDSIALLAAQKEAFQAAINGAPLAESLGILVRA